MEVITSTLSLQNSSSAEKKAQNSNTESNLLIEKSTDQTKPEATPCTHKYVIGDAFIQNCKLCGLYFPKVRINMQVSPI